MTSAELVDRGIAAHLGRSYHEAMSYFLAAQLGDQHGEALEALKASDLKVPEPQAP